MTSRAIRTALPWERTRATAGLLDATAPVDVALNVKGQAEDCIIQPDAGPVAAVMSNDIFADQSIEASDGPGISSRPVVCPSLGLDGDRQTHALFATDTHRCFAGHVSPVAFPHQSQYCLSGQFAACPKYQHAFTAKAGPPIREHRHVRLPRVKVRAMVLSLGAVIVAVTLMANQGSADQPPPSSNPPAAVVEPATIALATNPELSATQTPAATATTVPTSTPEPSPTLAPSPTPSPSPQTHIVQAGESLTDIARQYGITVQQLLDANASRTTIVGPGASLIIPSNP